MQMDVIHAFLSQSYWSPGIRREIVEKAVNSSVVAGMFDRTSGRQVAFARLVTDYATFGWLCDVFVLPEHRGRRLAQAMIDRIIAHPELATLRRFCLATRDAHGLYAGFGFQTVPQDRWMELQPPPANWQRPE